MCVCVFSFCVHNNERESIEAQIKPFTRSERGQELSFGHCYATGFRDTHTQTS